MTHSPLSPELASIMTDVLGPRRPGRPGGSGGPSGPGGSSGSGGPGGSYRPGGSDGPGGSGGAAEADGSGASGGGHGAFGHREHIHLAFIAAQRGDAADLLRDWIRQIAASHGTPGRYHETITTAWAQIVAHHVSANPAITDFDSFTARYPALLDKSLISRHYSQAALASPTARSTWIAPDLAPIP